MILVTGATGFLGTELVKQLAGKGISVRCTRRNTSTIPASLEKYNHLIQWVEADVNDVVALENAMEDVDEVYHCAAWVSFKPSDKERLIQTNIYGTANIVNACRQQQARLVHVSSIAAIGAAKPGELITEKDYIEDTPVNNHYATSKLEGEMEVWRGIAEGLSAVVVNPSLIIGAGSGKSGTGAIFETVRNGLNYYPVGSCGLVDVEDVAKCMIALMNSEITGERFIINAENWNYKDLFASIAQNFNKNPPSKQAKPWVLELAWRTAAFISKLTGKDPAVDRVSAQSASLVMNYDNAKIKKAIGFQFKPISQSIIEIAKTLD